MTATNLPSARQAVLDPSGSFERTWFLFFQTLYDRAGGASGSSTTDIDTSLFEDAGTAEIVAMALAIAQMAGQISQQQDLIAELQRQIDSINQGQLS